MVNKTDEFKISKSVVEPAVNKQLLDQTFPIKVIRSFRSTVNTCKHKMTKFGENNKNQ